MFALFNNPALVTSWDGSWYWVYHGLQHGTHVQTTRHPVLPETYCIFPSPRLPANRPVQTSSQLLLWCWSRPVRCDFENFHLN